MIEYDTQNSLVDILIYIFYFITYGYTVFVMVSYLILGVISVYHARKYLRRNTYTDYLNILQSPEAPSVSIIAPAFNEEASIIENIRSLLSVRYPNFEVIVVNDGSRDRSLTKLIEEYQLEPVNFAVNYQIETKKIKNVYKSKNPTYNNLVVVDKENGGKSDALNAALNVSEGDYTLNIDVDCILEEDCLLKLMKPFLEEPNQNMIATGGVVRIANNCRVEKGRIVEVNVPNKLLAQFQTLEYLRSFLLGRVAWGSLDGLLLISGALGVFQKELVIKCGGYDKDTIGEDMELTVRMRRYAREKDIDYVVGFVPDPLCWTEVPESWSVLRKQRNRWTRGAVETLLSHKRLFLNPFYGKMGMISYPYWLLFEWLAPLIEAFGIILLILFSLLGVINISFLYLFIALIYGYTVAFTIATLYIEEITFFQYKKRRQLLRLVIAGLIEPIIFHPFVVYCSVTGNWDYFFEGKKAWGSMKRVGFSKPGNSDRGKRITGGKKSGSQSGPVPSNSIRTRPAT
ncbi:MAG: glycosyltransferase family 2 protein [Croceimicrobium sp.]|nr:glycosyltransferase [Bacteroidota bacterium]